jgi:hypothetical protein
VNLLTVLAGVLETIGIFQLLVTVAKIDLVVFARCQGWFVSRHAA